MGVHVFVGVHVFFMTHVDSLRAVMRMAPANSRFSDSFCLVREYFYRSG